MRRLIFLTALLLLTLSLSAQRTTSRSWPERIISALFNRSSTAEQRLSLELVPFKSDAFTYYDGTIINDGGTYYFKGYNAGTDLLITNYDFPTDWSKGFPYKSAATVSAPAGNATFIAADVNNFFYDSGGTPNQIPVVSFFQDIDYAHKIFTKHQAQVLDGNGVEAFEPRVKEIVLYSNVKTGSDLTKCNSYYSVPTEDATAKWVDFNVATTGTGTKASPFKTTSEAFTAATAGGTIYIKTGATDYIDVNKSLKVIGLGYCRTTRTAAAAVTLRYNGTEFSGFITATDSRLYYNIGTPGGTIIVNRCKINTYAASYPIWFRGVTNESNFTIKNSIIPGGMMYTNCNLTIECCKIDGARKNTIYSTSQTENLKTLFYKYNRVSIPLNNTTGDPGYMINNAFSNMYIFNNEIRAENAMSLYTNTYTVIGTIEVTHNRYYGKDGYTTDSRFLDAEFDKCNNNYINFTSNNITVSITSSFTNSSIEINNNIFDLYSGFAVRLGAVVPFDSINIKNNVVIHKYAEDNNGIKGIYISPSVTSNAYTFQLNIEKNLFIAPTEYGSEYGGHTLLFVANCTKFNITKNKTLGSPLYGMIVKSYINGQTHDNSFVSYNVITNKGLIFKNITNASIIGNTIVDGLVFDEEGIGQIGDNIIVKNNIFKNTSGTFINAAKITNLVANQNIFDGNANWIYLGSPKTFAEWKALGLDTNSQNTSVNLTEGLWPSTPISIGEKLGTTYEDGLDISTNWGSTTTIPSVVTKKQIGTNWQVGAYVQ